MSEKLVAVLVGGALGSGARYLINTYASTHEFGRRFPVSTLLVNVVGSLFIGVIGAFCARKSPAFVFLATGVMGGFTTYSAFSLDAIDLWYGRGGEKAYLAIVYIVLTTALCLGVCWVGIKVGVWLGGEHGPTGGPK